MIVKWIKPFCSACFLIMLFIRPADALAAASEALGAWARSVAPSLLPFLIAIPALTGADVSSLLSRFTGGFLRFMRLPVHSTGALLIGLMSGSPAGASALAAVTRHPSDPPGACLRASILASGASPAFLLTSIAAGMLNQPAAGWILLRAQFLSALITVLLLRFTGSDAPARTEQAAQPVRSGVLSAMLTLLTISGYMVLFSVAARLLALLIHPAIETPLTALLELAGGCRSLACLPFPLSLRLPLISAVSCFGGVSVYTQSMSFLAPIGVRPCEYAAGKLIHSALAALITHLQLVRPLKNADPLFLSAAFLSVLIIALMIRTLVIWRRHPC